MPITVQCACGKQYPVKDEFAGQRVKCPDCGQVLTVPGVQEAAPDGGDEAVMVAPETEELEEVAEADGGEAADGDVIVAPPKKKSKKGLVFGILGCGCLVVFLGVGLVAGGVGLVVYYGVDAVTSGDFVASLNETDKDKDKDKDKEKDKTVDPNKDKPAGADKDKEKTPVVKGPVEKGPWKGHAAAVNALRFSDDGKFAMTAAGGLEKTPDDKIVLAPDNSIRFWNAGDGSEVDALRVDIKDGIAAAALSPSGRYAAVTYPTKPGAEKQDSDYDIHIWDLKTKQELKKLTGHRGVVLTLAFDNSGTQLLSGGRDNLVILWDVEKGTDKQRFTGHTGAVTGVAFVPNDPVRREQDLVVSCGADGTVRLWDPAAANVPQIRQFVGHKDAVQAVVCSRDGKWLFTAGGGQDPEIRQFDVAVGNEVKRFPGHAKGTICLAISLDGSRLVSGGADNVVRLWNVTTGQELAKYEGHTDPVRGVAFFPDGRRALSGADDKTLHVWDLPQSAPDIIAKLSNPDLKVKQQAVKDLAAFGDEAKPAVPQLMKCLTLGDVEFRKEVLALIKKLGGMPGPGDIDLMVKLLDDKNFPDGRLFALDGLATVGAGAKPALPGLLAVLKDNDPPTKRKAIAVIGQIGPDARDQVLKQMIGYLKDSDAETVKAAQEALPKLGKPSKDQIQNILAGFLSDANDNVRKYVMAALAEAGPDAGLAKLQIIDVARSDKLPELRKAALALLVKLAPKDKETITVLKVALKDLDPVVNLQAVAALAEVGPTDSEALAGLVQALDHKNDDVRKAAVDAFHKATFDKSQVKGLVTFLNTNRSPRVRVEIVDALGRLKADAADAAEDLGKVAKESDGELRVKAIQALAEIGPAGKKGAQSLVDVMNDKNEKSDDVRIETAMAICKMEAPEAKQALPILIKGLLVTDEEDAKQTVRKDKVSKVLVAIGKPAADPLAKTLEPAGDFYSAKVNTKEGMAMAKARRQVIEILLEMGAKNGKTGTTFLILSKVAKEDPDGEVRKLAKKAYDAFQ